MPYFPGLFPPTHFHLQISVGSAAYLGTHFMILLKIESFVMYLNSHYSSASIKRGD